MFCDKFKKEDTTDGDQLLSSISVMYCDMVFWHKN